MSIPKHIIGSLGDLGMEIIRETAKVPQNIADLTLEKEETRVGRAHDGKQVTRSEHVLQESARNPVKQGNPEFARNALQELVGYGRPDKHPDEWERKKQEEAHAKVSKENRKKDKRRQQIPNISTKPKQGSRRYGIHEKITEAKFNAKAE